MIFKVTYSSQSETSNENLTCPVNYIKWTRIQDDVTIYRCIKKSAHCKIYEGDKCVKCDGYFRIRQDVF